jgi:uroporphyrinogen-III synthase
MVRIINSRPAERNAELSRLLTQAGFEPVEIPFVDIRPHEEGQARAAATASQGFTGIFLSSPNGFRHFRDALLATQLEKWTEKPFYLVGAAARALVEEAGGKVAFFPEEASLEGFLKEYRPFTEPGRLPMAQRWLHPCSLSTRLEPAEFRKRSIEVVNLPVYKPGPPPDLASRLEENGRGAAAILFCSGSAVDNFFEAAPENASLLGRKEGPLAVSIGPSTTAALRKHGVEALIEAQHADDASLVDALKSAVGGMKTEVLKKTEAPMKIQTEPKP